MIKLFLKLFTLGFSIITVLFVICGFALILFAALQLWAAINPGGDAQLAGRFNSILESIGLLTIAVAALELGQTILEEEVRREIQVSVPTRVRRFLSRFMIVVVVSLSIEFLVAVFQILHGDISLLAEASAIGFATAALLVAWAVFVRLNISAEELEPEAMEQVKREDEKVG